MLHKISFQVSHVFIRLHETRVFVYTQGCDDFSHAHNRKNNVNINFVFLYDI